MSAEEVDPMDIERVALSLGIVAPEHVERVAAGMGLVEYQLLVTRGLLAEAGGTTVGVVVRMTERIARLESNLAAAQRELHRLAHGTEVESDGLCPEGIRAEGHRAWSRLWHREARRLWREVQDLSGMLTTARAGALREAADIAHTHGGISAYYAIAKLAAEVEP